MAVVDENRYKSNSYKSKAEAEKREVKKVIKGSSRVHQKTTGEKFKESFFGEDIGNLGDYLLFEVLVPLGRDLVDALFTSAKDLILYGETRETSSKGRSGGRRGGTYVSYDGYSRRSRRDSVAAKRARFDFSYIDFDTLDDIDDVIEEMRDIWSVYNEITVAQFYAAAAPFDPETGEGIRISPTDSNWGWLDIRAFTTADRRKVRSRNPETGDMEVKWILDVPRPKPLD